jgi:glycosyltransferase involved in cell wall biosynthesis
VERSHQGESAENGAFSDLHSSGVTTTFISQKSGLLGALMRGRYLANALNKMVEESRPALFHCRSYIPLAAVMQASRRNKIPFIFDMRGFWIDQRIEGKVWRYSHPLYRLIITYFRRLEANALKEAAAIVVLTNDAKQVVLSRSEYSGAPVYVVPCSVDLKKFKYERQTRETIRLALGVAEDEILLVYAGSSGSVYRTDVIFMVHAAAKRKGHRIKLLLLGKHDAGKLYEGGRAISPDLRPDDVMTKLVPHGEVANYLSAADFGACFLATTFSSLGVSATKVGEYLCCGLPVLTNSGIGDILEIVINKENGFVLPDFSENNVEKLIDAMPSLLRADRSEIAHQARQIYDLEKALDVYDSIYGAMSR